MGVHETSPNETLTSAIRAAPDIGRLARTCPRANTATVSSPATTGVEREDALGVGRHASRDALQGGSSHGGRLQFRDDDVVEEPHDVVGDLLEVVLDGKVTGIETDELGVG
jgi:hypothetical protein